MKKEDQEALARKALDKQRTLEDQDRAFRRGLDEESTGHLRKLFDEIQQATKAIVEMNGFDIVFAYPDAVTEEDKASPMYFDLKMRPQAAMPFYVSPSVDMSGMLVATLNKYFPAPGPIPTALAPPVPPVQQTGAGGGGQGGGR